jgi:hypothetical protein
MWAFLFSANTTILMLNVAIAAFLVVVAAMLIEKLLPRRSLPLRHGILCAALAVILISPLPVWFAGSRGLGLLPLALDEPPVAAAARALPPQRSSESPAGMRESAPPAERADAVAASAVRRRDGRANRRSRRVVRDRRSQATIQCPGCNGF